MAVVRKTAGKTKSTKTTSRPAAKSSTATKSTRTTTARSTAKKPTTRTATRTAPAPRTRKKVEVTPTRTAKAANAQATGAKTATKTKASATTKKVTGSRSVKTVAKPDAAPKTGPNRVVDETTGFAIGTDSHLIAMELLKGGADRAEIIERCAKKLPPTSNRGTPKPVANMVASVLGKMKDQGFTISSTWVLEPPTRASKARATRERNKRLGK